MSVARLLDGRRVCICAGSGGVGKTTTSAAIAMGMAARGAKVAVVTIDPARRLAASLGLDELGNEPAPIERARFEAQGLEMRGELWAMMLDPKRTFDELIARLAPDAEARDRVLSNRIYSQISSAVAGSQEFTAIAKLYELVHEADFDLIVLDTPPSRHALDFLDAPQRISGFLDGRALRAFMRPTGFGMRLVGAGSGAVLALLQRLTGIDLLRDLSEFLAAIGGMVDGFVERSRRVQELLADPATAFVLVTSPEREPIGEAIHFHRRLGAAGLRLGAVVANRVHRDGAARASDEAVARALAAAGLSANLSALVGASFREHRVLAARDRANLAELARELGDEPLIEVPQLGGDVHDVAGLLTLHEHLFAGDPKRGRLPASAR